MVAIKIVTVQQHVALLEQKLPTIIINIIIAVAVCRRHENVIMTLINGLINTT